MRDFWRGAINLIVTTEALDEAVDVTVDSTIAYFDESMMLRPRLQTEKSRSLWDLLRWDEEAVKFPCNISSQTIGCFNLALP